MKYINKHWVAVVSFLGTISQSYKEVLTLKQLATITLSDIISFLLAIAPYLLIIILWYKYQELKFNSKRIEIHSRIDAWLNVRRIRKIQNKEKNEPRDEEKKFINSKLRDNYKEMSEEQREHILECFYEQKNYWNKWPD